MENETWYSCLGCGEIFKVETKYGSKIKFSPCCGDSEVKEIEENE